ncbi:MAG: hypothetical protein QGI86_19055 [Candidatus Poribacteria bacterium]|nr:hypothetical protein [Candidatus Poribacteria bacterium]MDP6751040.1 hypothetical protein [Candidatus Poribacteria bacterium]MDP6998261.1 hypothetical protein [Candidatus Poribacteria bacterium]
MPEKNSESHHDNPFFSLPENTTAAAATAEIRQLADVEMVFYVYVIDEQNGLKGVISRAK